jgi:putative DNA primase/helicase
VGIWRRIKLIPFEVNIPKNKVDKNLKYKLRQEFPQILAWAVDGCMKWQANGLDEPECVREATKDYKQEMDLIAAFVEQCIVIDYDTEQKISASDLFAIYRGWAKENNEWEMSAKRFGMEMVKKTPEKVKTAKGIMYGKIKLTEYALKFLPQRNFSIGDFYS